MLTETREVAIMAKKFKQVSTGLILSCSREDVIAQYEKYPEQYIPVSDAPVKPVAKPAPKASRPEKK